MARGFARIVLLAVVALVICSRMAAAGPHEGRRDRPAALVPLYLTFAGLQALDVHSTMAAVGAGRREANPMVRSALDSPAHLLLLKGGTAAGVVFLSEKIWPRNRTAAVVTMFALNSAYVTIAANNYRAAKRR
jgi:hypothetical protein